MSAEAWFEGLSAGHEERTPERVVDEEVLRRAVAAAGYRHRLFTDPAYAAASPLGATPLPGGVLLGFLGGLVELCPVLSAAPVVLAGFDAVRFRRPVLAGDVLSASVRVEGKRTTDGGTRLVDFSWEARNQRGETVLLARATFAVTGDA